MAIVSRDDVFNFMGTSKEQRLIRGDEIDDLIDAAEQWLEYTCSIKLQTDIFTNKVFTDGDNCLIFGRKLKLCFDYYDVYSINQVTQYGFQVPLSTTWGDSGQCSFNSGELLNLQGNWSTARNAITISGKRGFVNIADDSSKAMVKNLIKQKVAIDSKMWVRNLSISGSVVETVVLEMDDQSKTLIKNLSNRSYL